MSRRVANPAADRAAQNQATLKQLVKLESNKSCADCKRNKHPRWASWNLGIFICIRCSGIHRGMGTHISRVKSVDLDSWTDEQLQSMLRWGNARANKYWEAKLAPGHVPAEAKIENFIRTKYESKRWVMDGPMPDPSSLDAEGDDDIPLNVVQEKAKLERSSSQRTPAASSQPQPPSVTRRAPVNIDLFGDDTPSVPARPSTTEPPTRAPPPKAEAAAPKQTKADSSLLGLDFFGAPQSTQPTRPASTNTTSTSSMPSRPDLKQSILSLYASAPRTQTPAQSQTQQSNAFGGLQSPSVSSPSAGLGGLNDAFGGLSFASPPPQQQAPPPKASAFDSLIGPGGHRTTSSGSKPITTGFGSGGGFFDAAPQTTSPPRQQQAQRTFSSSSGFGDFNSSFATSPTAQAPKAAPSSGMDDLFGLTSPATSIISKAPPPAPSASNFDSAFNLSAPSAPSAPKPQHVPAPAHQPAYSAFGSGFSNMDAWGSNDAWNTPDPAPTAKPAAAAAAAASKPAPPQQTPSFGDFGGWNSSTTATASSGFGASKPTPQISQDEDFGGWSSAAPASASKPSATSTGSKPIGGLNDDLFSNVWE